jgi:hypothetical protein
MTTSARSRRSGAALLPTVTAALIAAMFSGNVPGAFHDPSDMSTMYQDSIGSTPVTGLEQPVGLILDRSAHAVLSVNLAPTLTEANWPTVSGSPSLVFSGTTVSLTSASTGGRGAVGRLTIGKVYRAEMEVYEYTSGSFYMPYDGSGGNGRLVARKGVFSHTFRATTTSIYLYSTDFIGKVRNVTVSELPVVEKLTNSTFNVDLTGWTTPVTGGGTAVWASGGTVRLDSGPTVGDVSRLRQSFTSKVGQWYELTMTVSSWTGLAVNTQVAIGADSSGSATYGSIAVAANGVVRRIFQSTGTTVGLAFYIGNSDGTPSGFNLDNVYIREVSGQAAFQTTVAARPTLSARRNMFLQTEAITNAAWVKTTTGTASAPVVTDNFGVAPDGTTTAARVQLALNGGTTTSDYCTLYQSVAVVTGGRYAYGVWLKTNDGTTKIVQLRDDNSLISNTLLTVTDTWQFFQVNGTTTTATNTTRLWLRGAQGTADSADLLMWHPQFEVGAAVDRYQRVAATNDYDALGFPMYLRFDGVDDAMATGLIDMTASPYLAVAMAGMVSATAYNTIVAGGATAVADGRWGITFNDVASSGKSLFFRRGDAGQQYKSDGVSLTYQVPRRFTLLALADFTDGVAGTGISLRGDALVGSAGSGAAVTPRAGYVNEAIYFGSRGSPASSFFGGQIYGQVILNRALTPHECLVLERFAAQLQVVAPLV